MEAIKQRGNAAFLAGDFESAVIFFTEALALDSTSVILYSNRSAVDVKLGRTSDALRDADACIRIDASWAKGYGRKAEASRAAEKYEDALGAYEGAEAKEEALARKAEYAIAREGRRCRKCSWCKRLLDTPSTCLITSKSGLARWLGSAPPRNSRATPFSSKLG
jgi:tetratricopeptide (TPR) repeat protein